MHPAKCNSVSLQFHFFYLISGDDIGEDMVMLPVVKRKLEEGTVIYKKKSLPGYSSLLSTIP